MAASMAGRLWGEGESVRLKDKVAIITGGGRGIGRATALALANEGAAVVLVARSAPELESVAAECQALGATALAIPTDVSQKSSVTAMAESVFDRFGHVEILVNNAGVFMPHPVSEITEEEWDTTFLINTKGMFLCTQAVFGRMCAQGSGHIVNVSSLAGQRGFAQMGAYCASKFAMNGFTDVTNAEGNPHGVKASVVCPGPVDTSLRRHYYPNDIVENLTRPEEIADVILLLVCQSPQAHTPEVVVRTPLPVGTALPVERGDPRITR